MKIISTKQAKIWDKKTLQQLKLTPLELMWKAAKLIASSLEEKLGAKKNNTLHFFCGPGNNGGDGILAASILHAKNFNTKLWVFSADSKKQYSRLLGDKITPKFNQITNPDILPSEIKKDDIVIDAIFGIGLNKKIGGIFAKTIRKLNEIEAYKIAIDIPSGLEGDSPTLGLAFKANLTLTIQSPKLAFFLEDSQKFVGDWLALDIGLISSFTKDISPIATYVDSNLVAPIKLTRNKFSHKGNYGHVLVCGGLSGNFGSNILCSKASLKSGCGLVSLLGDTKWYPHIISVLPEAMREPCSSLSEIKYKMNEKKYEALAIGMSMGTKNQASILLEELLKKNFKTLVLDADAINIIAKNPKLLKYIGNNCIFTPHPKEFSRITSTKNLDSWQEMLVAQKFAKTNQVYLILKKAHSLIFTPQAEIYISSTGNPAMATAGSGDVLSGILAGLLAQSYSMLHASLLGVYIHGAAGDIACDKLGFEAVTASNIIDNIGQAFKNLN